MSNLQAFKDVPWRAKAHLLLTLAALAYTVAMQKVLRRG
jgi:hypothetical protein